MSRRSSKSRAGKSVWGKRAWRVKRRGLAAAGADAREGSIEELALLGSEGWRVENVFRMLVRKARGFGREVGGGGMGKVQGFELAPWVGVKEGVSTLFLQLFTLVTLLCFKLVSIHYS